MMKKTKIAFLMTLVMSLVLSAFPTVVLASAPSAPTELAATGLTPSKFTLNWKSSTGATSYEIYRKVGTAAESKIATMNDTGALDKLDVVFLIDYSGSMGGEIASVKNNISSFANTLAQQSVDFQLGIVAYSDVTVGYTQYLSSAKEPLVKYPFTNVIADFQSSLNGLSVKFGGDLPESGLESIMDPTDGALTFPFREGAAKNFVLVTDAMVHSDPGSDYTNYNITDVANQLLAQNVQVTVIGPNSGGTRTQLETLSNTTKGSYLDIAGNFATELSNLATQIVNKRSYDITGLKENTTYTMRLKACSTATTCSAFSSPLTVTTPTDTTPPSKPTGLEAENITTKSFVLGWNPATDDVAVSKYFVKINGTRITKGAPPIDTSTTGVSLLITGTSSTSPLVKNTTYAVAVEACDVKNNCITSDPINVTTKEKSEPPSPPEDLIAFNVSRDSFVLSWTDAEDDEGIKGYKVYYDTNTEDETPPVLYDDDIEANETELVISSGALPGGGTLTMAPATTYSMTVVAVDLDDQESPESDELDVTTLAANESMGPLIQLTKAKGTLTASAASISYMLKKRAAIADNPATPDKNEADPGYAKSTAKLTVRLINKAKVTQATVINNVDTPVAKLKKVSVPVSAANVTSGKYYVVFTAVDPTDSKKRSFAYKRLVVDKVKPVISDISAPTVTDMTIPKSITYDLAENNSSGTLVKNNKTFARVTISILSKATNKVVKKIAVNKKQLSAEDINISWNVKDSKGINLPDGAYQIVFDAIDTVKNKADRKTADFSIERRNPVISAVSDKPDPLTVAGTAVSTIKYTLSENANVTIVIVDKDNNPVTTLMPSTAKKMGANTITWNGKVSGTKVAAGKYTYKIDAVDGASKQAVQATGTITVK
jgi:flagellar hook assembly protein FlgD